MGSKRPLVQCNLAIDIQGDYTGSFSTPEDWARVHALREEMDAVGVGGATYRHDRPQLTARAEYLGRPPRRQPRPVVFSSSGNVPPHPLGELIVVGPTKPIGNVCWLQAHDFYSGLCSLSAIGITSLLVEGGLTLHRALLALGLIDSLTIFVRGATSRDMALAAAERSLPAHFGLNEPFARGYLLTSRSPMQFPPLA